jgi:copper(I)-binding protein
LGIRGVDVIAQPAIARRIGPRLIMGLLAACTTVLTACATGQHASTSQQTPAVDANNGVVGAIELRAVAILPPAGDKTSYASGDDATITAVIVNTGNTGDTLTKVSSSAAGGFQLGSGTSASAAPASSSSTAPAGATTIDIPADSSVSFGVPSSTSTLTLTGLTAKLYPGQSVAVTFTFANAGSVTVSVPVQLTTTPGSSTVPVPSGANAG